MKTSEVTTILCSLLLLGLDVNNSGFILGVFGFSQTLIKPLKPSLVVHQSSSVRGVLFVSKDVAGGNGTSKGRNYQLTKILKPERKKETSELLNKQNEESSADDTKAGTPRVDRTEVNTLSELNEIFNPAPQGIIKNNDKILKSIHVKGDTQKIGSKDDLDYVHPVLELLHHRRKQKTDPTADGEAVDKFKVALAIEGGGMRGCVSAGMVTAIHYLGLEDCIDVVYGSSAGSLIGAYFITRQLPWFGPEIYYDSLTTAGNRFIDPKRLLRAAGLGFFNPRLWYDNTFRSIGKPVLDLSYLLERTMQKKKILDWEKFVEMQKVQPLKVVASGLKSEKAVVFDMENGGFSNMEELGKCMHASMLLPGVSGPVVNMERDANKTKLSMAKMKSKKDNHDSLADALIYEPLPYRSAVTDGATHVIVLRTRADGTDVSGKPSVAERLIMKRFFIRKNKFPNIYKHIRMQLHKKIYAEDIIKLNEASKSERDYKDTSMPHLMPIAIPPGSEEITRLETGREAIFNGVRLGFARAYDALVEDPSERGKGMAVAKYCFPDEILDYNPLDIDNKSKSAFGLYLDEKNTEGELIDFAKKVGKTALERGTPR